MQSVISHVVIPIVEARQVRRLSSAKGQGKGKRQGRAGRAKAASRMSKVKLAKKIEYVKWPVSLPYHKARAVLKGAAGQLLNLIRTYADVAELFRNLDVSRPEQSIGCCI